MPKPCTSPTLYDNCLQIHLSKLKGWGYLKSDQIQRGTPTWHEKGKEIGSISILVNTTYESPFIELDYKYRESARYYRIYLVSIPSNLGIGRIWYFECPNTRKRCRKLYSIE